MIEEASSLSEGEGWHLIGDSGYGRWFEEALGSGFRKVLLAMHVRVRVFVDTLENLGAELLDAQSADRADDPPWQPGREVHMRSPFHCSL